MYRYKICLLFTLYYQQLSEEVSSYFLLFLLRFDAFLCLQVACLSHYQLRSAMQSYTGYMLKHGPSHVRSGALKKIENPMLHTKTKMHYSHSVVCSRFLLNQQHKNVFYRTQSIKISFGSTKQLSGQFLFTQKR